MNTVQTAAIDLVALFVEEERRLEQYFTRRVRDGGVAEDLAAETYLQAVSSRHRFNGENGEPVQWLYGIAHHVFTHHRRRAETIDAALLRLPLDRDIDGDDEREHILRADDQGHFEDALVPALRELPEPQRTALTLRVVHDLPYSEIASRLDIDRQAARARVSRALRALAVALASSDAETLLH